MTHPGVVLLQVGEVMDSRYEVYASVGKGVFGTVLRARDLLRQEPAAAAAGAGAGAGAGHHPEVAIKMIRSNDTMTKAAQLEMRILRVLAENDPDNRRHCIRMLRHFEYRHHVCMVFEAMVGSRVWARGSWSWACMCGCCWALGQLFACCLWFHACWPSMALWLHTPQCTVA
jgi:hypothetical protein